MSKIQVSDREARTDDSQRGIKTFNWEHVNFNQSILLPYLVAIMTTTKKNPKRSVNTFYRQMHKKKPRKLTKDSYKN
jgi:hypothetical protein